MCLGPSAATPPNGRPPVNENSTEYTFADGGADSKAIAQMGGAPPPLPTNLAARKQHPGASHAPTAASGDSRILARIETKAERRRSKGASRIAHIRESGRSSPPIPRGARFALAGYFSAPRMKEVKRLSRKLHSRAFVRHPIVQPGLSSRSRIAVSLEGA